MIPIVRRNLGRDTALVWPWPHKGVSYCLWCNVHSGVRRSVVGVKMGRDKELLLQTTTSPKKKFKVTCGERDLEKEKNGKWRKMDKQIFQNSTKKKTEGAMSSQNRTGERGDAILKECPQKREEFRENDPYL